MSVIPTYPGRPSTIKIGPVTVFVSVKDAEWYRMRSYWRQRMMNVHPDRHTHKVLSVDSLGRKRGVNGRILPSTGEIRKVLARYLAWRNQQIREYATLGLLPPDGKGEIVPPYGNKGGRRGFYTFPLPVLVKPSPSE